MDYGAARGREIAADGCGTKLLHIVTQKPFTVNPQKYQTTNKQTSLTLNYSTNKDLVS